MAVTGSGTQADPYIVTNYTDFISLSDHAYPSDKHMYIQFFDNEHPNQTIDCNTYGSEFKWNTFVAGTPDGSGDTIQYYVDINLNGCTIKNFLIKEGVPMFKANRRGATYSWANAHIIIHDGSLRNMFMGSATSKIALCENDGATITFSNISFSTNTTGLTVSAFDGGNGKRMYFDNCAFYVVHATLSTGIMRYCNVTDSDFELHINDQNSQNIFPNSSFTDCRFQGKIGGHCVHAGVNNDSYVFDQCGLSDKALNFTNCVIDLDLTDSLGIDDSSYIKYGVFLEYNGFNINTNVICNSHYPSVGGERQYTYPSSWNYMPHEGNNGHNIRNGDWLNSQGFTVVEVVGS